MKTALLTLSLLASLNVMADAKKFTEGTTLLVSSPTMLSYVSTTGDSVRKAEATAILNDAQEAMQSGKFSALLNQKINDVLDANNEISEIEALEVVIESAQIVLQ